MGQVSLLPQAFHLFYCLLQAWEASGHLTVAHRLSQSTAAGAADATLSDAAGAVVGEDADATDDVLHGYRHDPVELSDASDDSNSWSSVSARFANLAHDLLGKAGHCSSDGGTCAPRTCSRALMPTMLGRAFVVRMPPAQLTHAKGFSCRDGERPSAGLLAGAFIRAVLQAILGENGDGVPSAVLQAFSCINEITVGALPPPSCTGDVRGLPGQRPHDSHWQPRHARTG